MAVWEKKETRLITWNEYECKSSSHSDAMSNRHKLKKGFSLADCIANNDMLRICFVQQKQLRPKCMLDYFTLLMSVLNEVTFCGKTCCGFALLEILSVFPLSSRVLPKQETRCKSTCW